MQIIEKDINYYNTFFSNYQGIKLTENFSYDSEEQKYLAKFYYTKGKNKFYFHVAIPKDFPFGNILFYSLDLKGYPHQNYNTSVCLNVQFVNHLPTKLKLELEKLTNWVEKYVLNEEKDDYYEYSPAEFNKSVYFIFQEDDSRLNIKTKKKFGEFHFSILNQSVENNKITRITAYAQDIGNLNYNWSQKYKDHKKYYGLWAFIGKEPVLNNKHKIENWNDLFELLPRGFSESMDEFIPKMTANYKVGPKSFQKWIFFAIGYNIPNGKSSELHWDLILLPKVDFKRKKKNYQLHKYNKKIIWAETTNASYNRFFGRGMFHSSITDSKILVLGLGAIGSSLSEILVRGGAKSMHIADIDSVEPGNICRSKLTYRNIGVSKVFDLETYLSEISPFVQISTEYGIKAVSKIHNSFNELRERFKKFDIIFDCTASNEIVQMLNDFHLKHNNIYHISITDKANELICVTNKDNNAPNDRLNQLLFSLGSIYQPEFREGTGCWHPTFEASFFDINQLLNFALKKINDFAIINSYKSFFIYENKDTIRLSYDIKFYQPKLKLTLTIESHCLSMIKSLAEEHYPNEFGGILIGNYIDNNTELVISKILTPVKYKSSSSGFEPNNIELTELLNSKEVIDKNSNLMYVGDWHSHPDNSNQYSIIDFHSIEKIATTNSVKTKNPILLIVSINKNRFVPGFYVYKNGKLLKFKEKTPYNIGYASWCK